MKLQHTAQFAFSFNVRVIDDAGRDVSAWLMPVVYWWLWIPSWLYEFWILDFGFSIGLFGKARDRERIIQNRQSKIQNYLAGWRDDLRLTVWAAWLLLRDRRFADVAS